MCHQTIKKIDGINENYIHFKQINFLNQNRSLLSHAVDRHNKLNAAKKIANNHDLIRYENKDNSVSEERDLGLQVTEAFNCLFFLSGEALYY